MGHPEMPHRFTIQVPFWFRLDFVHPFSDPAINPRMKKRPEKMYTSSVD